MLRNRVFLAMLCRAKWKTGTEVSKEHSAIAIRIKESR